VTRSCRITRERSAGYSKTGVNNFMYWKLMEWAVENGCGASTSAAAASTPGSAKFKKNMGFPEEPLHYYFALGEGVAMPEFHPSNPKLSIYKRTWSRLPAGIARVVRRARLSGAAVGRCA
jgi:hypothetical protein